MNWSQRPLRVLYSFPHKLGAGRICYIAWQQVKGLAAAGADVLVFPGAIHKPILAENVTSRTTLARGKLRIPYRLLGITRSCILHDYIVARRLERLAGEVDIVHTWPLGSLRTLRTAAAMGIPTVLERPNTHTRYAYEVVQNECARLGITLPPGSEHAYCAEALGREIEEYESAHRLLCPSDFTAQSFLNENFPPHKLVRHQYGYDPALYYPSERIEKQRGLTMLFAGYSAVRKGLHFALEAWLASPAHRDGTFLIAGEFLPSYAAKLSAMLSHPSVHILGQRNDIPELMRKSDIMVLPTIEEGFGLVCVEALGSGCVPLVSAACTEFCQHMHNSLVHRIGDVQALTQHITMLHQDSGLLERLRQGAVKTTPHITWEAAGRKLLEVYANVVTEHESLRENRSTTILPPAAPAQRGLSV